MMSQFIILSLPRSRSAWLTRFLSYGNVVVGHDLAAFCGSIGEWLERFSELNGVVETGAVVGWRVLRKMVPHAKMVIVRRPVRQIVNSFDQLGVEIDILDLFTRSLALDMVATLPEVMVIEYHQLADENICARLFEHCLSTPHNHNWWRAIADTNVQINMGERIKHLQSHQSQLVAFRQEVEAIQAQLAMRGLN